MPAPLIEFPADDPDRARRFWRGVLGVSLAPRPAAAGSGWQTDADGLRLGVHERGPGPGDTAALPYFTVADLATALERALDLGGSIIHPGDRWAVCRDSEGSPFALAATTSTPAAFTPRLQLGEPHHSAYVVEDIETTVGRLVAQLGAGPFFLIENVPLEGVVSRGEPAEFIHNSAFGYCGDGAIELIEPVRLAPARVAKGFSAPRPRIQHVAYVVPSGEVANLRSALEERGLPQYLSSRLGEVETTLHDASAALGHDIEIHADNEALRNFFGMVKAAAEGWDGSEPLRPLGS